MSSNYHTESQNKQDSSEKSHYSVLDIWPLKKFNNKKKLDLEPNSPKNKKKSLKSLWNTFNDKVYKDLDVLEVDVFGEIIKNNTFFDRSSFGMALVDIDEHFLRVNQTFADMLGYTCEELYNLKQHPISHPDDLETTKEAIETLIEGNTFFCHLDKRYRHKNGDYIWVSIDFYPVRSKSENKIYFLGQIQDNTNQHISDEQIRIIDQKYSLIISSLGEGVYAIDLEGKCLFINPAALDILGYTTSNLPDISMHDLFHTNSGNANNACSICDFSANDRKLQKGIETFRCKDGELITVKYITTPLVEGEKVIGSVVIFRDDTARLLAENSLRESESRFRALYNSTPSMLLSINPEGNITEVSDMWLKTMCYQRGFVRGNRISQFVDPASLSEMKLMLERAREDGRYQSNELNLLTHENVIIETETETVAEYNSSGELERFLMVSVDVTEKRKTEQQLMQSQKMEAIGQLTGGIAHDFNNILQVIIGNLQILERQFVGRDEPKSQEKIDRVINAADKARDLTRRLLAFSRRQVLETTESNFNEQLLEFQTFLTRSLREDIELNLCLCDDLWVCDIDLSQFENAILNLCVNSAGAMPEGGVITIETKNEVLEDKDLQYREGKVSGNYISVSITDTGTGIDPEILPNVIDPFFTTKETDKGTGLGLSMVYGFVEQTGGFMEIRSEMGIGTKMALYFPGVIKENVDTDRNIQKKNNRIVSGEERTILLVEDNPDVQEVIVSVLEDHNYKVIAFDNPLEAKNSVERGLRFDLLLTDVIMPGDYRGPDLADAIREVIPELRVIFLSGYADDAFLSHRSLGNNEKFLSKPIDNFELLTEIQALLQKD